MSQQIGKKKNTFRCFAILQVGINDQMGEFLLIHKRGCKRTFEKEREQIMKLIDEHHYGQNTTQEFNNPKYNWLGVKEMKNQDSRVWFLFLVFPDCKREQALTSLRQMRDFCQQKQNYREIGNKIEYEDKLKQLEQKYGYGVGDGDGFETEYDDEDIKQQAQQLQLEKQQQQVQQQTNQQHQQQQGQVQQKNNQQLYLQSSKINPYNQQDQQKRIQNQMNGIEKIGLMQSPAFNIKDGLIATQQQLNISNNQLQSNQASKIDDKNQKEKNEEKKPKIRGAFRLQNAKEQMQESNNQKQADGLIGSLIVGTLFGAITSLAI